MFKKIVSLSKSELKELLEKDNSCVVLKNAVIDVFLVPCYLNDVRNGLRHALNKKLKTYDSKLEGIILGYDKIKVDLSEGRFSGRNAEVSYPVSCDCYVFQPVVGNSLEGIVNRMSEDHIGCVCHKYFNATIKRPEDIGYELWKMKKIYLNQSITFRVKDLDYTGLIPVIEGDFEDFKKYFPEAYAASSESGIEDITVSKKTNKKKKETAVNSTQLQSSKFQDNSDSGLDFDFLSPIPTPKIAKQPSKKRKKSPEPGSSKAPEKKKRKKTDDNIDPGELMKRLLEEQRNTYLVDTPDEPVPTIQKKRTKKIADSPSKNTNNDNVPSSHGKQLLITSFPSFNTDASTHQDVKPDVIAKSVPKSKSPKKEKKSPEKSQGTPSKPVVPVEPVATDTGKVKKKGKKSTEQALSEIVVENGAKVAKKPRKTNTKKPATPRKPKKKDDPAKQMEFYLKKMMELAKSSNDSSLLANMLSSNLNLELKKEST